MKFVKTYRAVKLAKHDVKGNERAATTEIDT
jgi:hypothetical protein